MKDTPLNKFIEQLMKIEPDYAGMSGASAGILGATGTHGQIVNDLRKHAMAFASEYVRQPTCHEEVIKLSHQLEGALESVRLVNGVSDAKLAGLLSDLRTLMDELPAT